VLYFYYIVLSI